MIVIIGGLTFFPALALGPIAEHFAMLAKYGVLIGSSRSHHPWKPHMIRKRMPVSALLDPKIVGPAIGSAFVKLDPRTLIKNPVMFVVEIVAALTTIDLRARAGHGRREPRLHVPDHPVAVDHRAVRQLLRSDRRRARQGAGRFAAAPAHRDAGQAADRGRTARTTSSSRAPASRSATSCWSRPAT